MKTQKDYIIKQLSPLIPYGGLKAINHPITCNLRYYYRIRAIDPKSLDPIKRASRFIYLNKTCYNGLYRENSKGEFNVPFGRYKNPKIVDEENLKAVSEFLRSCDLEVLCGDFEETCKKAKAGDFVYFDPPYYSTFSNYTRENFTEKDHIRLRDLFVELDKKGVYLMLTNSNTDFIKNLLCLISLVLALRLLRDNSLTSMIYVIKILQMTGISTFPANILDKA